MKNSKMIDTPTFQVKENTLWFEHYFLQISNITQISAREADTFPLKYVVCTILAGLIFLSAKMNLLGVLCIMAGVVLLCYIIYQKQNPKYNLYIELNSGHVFRFHCQTENFANRVMAALRECINTPNTAINVDFRNSKIYDSHFFVGEKK